jgi:hypothetical protein
MTSPTGYCPTCGAPRQSGDYFCPRCHAYYPDQVAGPPFSDGFGAWVRRGAAIACGFLIVGLIVSLAWFVLASLALMTLIRPAV